MNCGLGYETTAAKRIELLRYIQTQEHPGSRGGMAAGRRLMSRLLRLLTEVGGRFRRCRGGGVLPSLSSEDESKHDFSGGGPQSESKPPRVLAACQARVRTAGAVMAGVHRAGVAAGVRAAAAGAAGVRAEGVALGAR